MSEPTCTALTLIRVGHAYEYFDQSDYDLVTCDHPAEMGPCGTCWCPRNVGDTEFLTHQVATIGNQHVLMCYGGCMRAPHTVTPDKYHAYTPTRCKEHKDAEM